MERERAYMFKLRRVRSFNIHQRWVHFNHALRDKVVHLSSLSSANDFLRSSAGHAYTCQVSLNTEPLDISTTKDESAEVLVDLLVEGSSRGQVRGNLFRG
jgi:hypothetical protein